MKSFVLPIYNMPITVFWDETCEKYLDAEQLNVIEDDSTVAFCSSYVHEGTIYNFIYVDVDRVKEYDQNLERIIDHEIIHMIFFIFKFLGLEIIEGGRNEHFTYLHNYLDEQIWKILTESKLTGQSE
jgi:hypothetical protein